LIVGAVGDVRDHLAVSVQVVRELVRVVLVVLEAEHAPADVDASRARDRDQAAIQLLHPVEAVAAGGRRCA
jgi:hypothetical protein